LKFGSLEATISPAVPPIIGSSSAWLAE